MFSRVNNAGNSWVYAGITFLERHKDFDLATLQEHVVRILIES